MIRTLTNETFTSINVMDQGPYYNLIAYYTVEIQMAMNFKWEVTVM